jgi:hypothetical protein
MAVVSSFSMARKASGGRQEKLKGPLRTILPSWRKRLRDELERRQQDDYDEWTQEAFAFKCGLSPGAISLILGEQVQARVEAFARIHRALGWPEPADDADYETVVAGSSLLRKEDRAIVARLVESLMGKL